MALGLIDIDSLCLSVRDRESRRLIMEAITAYRGGAFRSAIVSTWIAVAYDIIAKARELAGQGDSAAKVLVKGLDTAIENKTISKLQQFERELLETANEKLLLFSHHEFVAFSRLQEDRNLCAHPAFVVEDELYQPTPDLVRTHIGHALQYLLTHAPLQGKSAVDRFKNDLLSLSFPVTEADISSFVKTKYLDRAKDALVKNLLTCLIKALFDAERAQFAGHESQISQTIKVIATVKPAIYDDLVPNLVGTWFDSVPDEALLRVCTFVNADQRLWTWLSESVRLRVKQLLVVSDIATLNNFSVFEALDMPEFAQDLENRFNICAYKEKIAICAANPCLAFVKHAIQFYADSGSWRGAEDNGRRLILSYSHLFTPDDIAAILVAANNNNQIYEASGTPDILLQLFERTMGLLNQTRQHWQQFLETRQTANEGFYPMGSLRRRVAEYLTN